MNEVSTQTVALLVDALAQRGIGPDALWADLGLTPAQLRPGARIGWDTWVAMLERVERACGDELETLFVPGAGARTGHPFVRLANAFLSVRDLFALFARWGLRRNVMVMTARFEPRDAGPARFTITIEPSRAGSRPTLRFLTGLLRALPTLQGLAPAVVTLATATEHEATYDVELPLDRSRLARLRRAVRVASGATAAIDELEQQATEIALKNAALERQLAETERARAEIAAQDEWLRLALDAGRVGIWRWSPTTNLVRLSDELGHVIGQPGQVELDTATVMERIHRDDIEQLAATVRTALARGEPFDVECRVLRTTGEVSWLQIKGRLGPPGPRGAAEVLGTVGDITEKKLLDSRLQFADRLIAAGTLAAGVAHEVNNPLAYVMATLDLMKLRLREHPQADVALRESLSQVKDGLERIRDVVADLRAFARPEEEVVARTELRDVCHAAIRIVSSLVRHRAVITTEHAADTPAVIANQSRLGQVVINLIVNASHALPERPDADNRIVVRTRRLATGEAAIEVSDNGAGIPPDVVPRLFDPFFTTKSDTGTGLGLSVCQRIVQSLRGRIDVETAVGVGSTFTVVLPAAPPVEPAAEPVPVPAARPAQRRVLIVDDEPIIRRVLSTMLAAEGYVATQADGGRAALARAGSGEPFDVVLCDLQMPDLDGVALHDELARIRPDLLPRLVFMSGGAIGGRTRAFASRGDIVLLDKPFTLGHLLAALERIPA